MVRTGEVTGRNGKNAVAAVRCDHAHTRSECDASGLLVMYCNHKNWRPTAGSDQLNSSSQLLSAFFARAAACGSATTLPPRTVAPMTIAALMMTTFLMMY